MDNEHNHFIQKAKSTVMTVGSKTKDTVIGIGRKIVQFRNDISDYIDEQLKDPPLDSTLNDETSYNNITGNMPVNDCPPPSGDVANDTPKNTGDSTANDTPKKSPSKKIGLDDKLQSAIADYNAAYATLKDHSVRLFNQRERSMDLLHNIENLVNSIANHPKTFDTDMGEIQEYENHFKNVCDFAHETLDAAQNSVIRAGAGIAGGMAVRSLAPSAVMRIATLFGKTSTDTAISILAGTAQESAAAAWTGGGHTLLALSGAIGWSIAGASLLTSVLLFANKKIKLNNEKKQEIDSVLHNTIQLQQIDIQLTALLDKTANIREELTTQYTSALPYYNHDFSSIPYDGQKLLAAIVNNAKSLSVLLEERM